MISRRREAKFEVVVEQGGRPNIDGVFPDERLAMERAKYLLSLAKYSVVRVVKVNDAGKEETVFEKAYMGGGKVTTISHIDTAACCSDVLQVYSFDSRMTLLRLFRNYFDDQAVIPAEQLHRYFPLRYFEREATLFNPGLSRLATLQAPTAGVKVFDRQDQLVKLFNEVKALAQHAEDLAPFDEALSRRGVSALLEQAAAERPPEQRDRIVTHAFSTALEPFRDWPQKLKAILRFHVEGEPEAERVVDELLCETVDGREPIKALIGYAPDLSSALLSLLATARGELDDRLPHTNELLDLSNAVAGGTLTRVRTALLNRVQGGLEGSHPLTRSGSAADARALQAIVDRLAAFDGYMGGPPMASALTKRAKMAMGTDGHDLPFEDTVTFLSGRLGGPAARIGYLLDLASSEFGRRRMSHLVQRVADIFGRVKSARELAPAGASLDDMRDGLGKRLRGAGIPRLLADQLIAKIAAIPDDERAFLPLVTTGGETVDLSAPRKTGAKLVLSLGGRRHVLPDEGETLVIGRSHDCQMRLDVASASRRHAVIDVRGGDFVLSDHSRNGTRVLPAGGEGQTLTNGESLPLKGRGEIVIGSSQAGETPARIAFEVRG